MDPKHDGRDDPKGDKHVNYYDTMEKMGRPFCDGPFLKAVAMGELMFEMATGILHDVEFKGRAGIQRFLSQKPDVEEALRDSDNIFIFHKRYLDMNGKPGSAWHTV